MTDTPKPTSKIIKIHEMTVTNTRGHNEKGEFVHIHATKGGKPFDDEDSIQLQILEYEVSNPRGGCLVEVPRTSQKRSRQT